MLAAAIAIAAVMVGVALLLNLYRLLRGPDGWRGGADPRRDGVALGE